MEQSNAYSLEQFLKRTGQSEPGEETFQLESPRLLEVHLDGSVWTKAGAMVAYLGEIKFTREGILEHGLGRLAKKLFTSEGVALTKAEGRGRLYLADAGKEVQILHLTTDSITVNGRDLLAFEPSIDWNIHLMRKIGGMLGGGLFNVALSGTGLLAITTHFEPLTLQVTPDRPVYTDPNATVAWSSSLQPDFHVDVSLKTFVGRGSGESLQMVFRGEGFVVVQSVEEQGGSSRSS